MANIPDSSQVEVNNSVEPTQTDETTKVDEGAKAENNTIWGPILGKAREEALQDLENYLAYHQDLFQPSETDPAVRYLWPPGQDNPPPNPSDEQVIKSLQALQDVLLSMRALLPGRLRGNIGLLIFLLLFTTITWFATPLHSIKSIFTYIVWVPVQCCIFDVLQILTDGVYVKKCMKNVKFVREKFENGTLRQKDLGKLRGLLWVMASVIRRQVFNIEKSGEGQFN